MKKILTVTLNPAIDVRYNVENMRIGEVNRTKHIEKNAGGGYFAGRRKNRE